MNFFSRENVIEDKGQTDLCADGFCHEHTVSIGDTNITKSVYFTKYLEWLGYAREAMVRSKVSTEKIKNGDIILVTRNTAIAYLQEYNLYELARIIVTVGSVSETTATLYFRFLGENFNHYYSVAKQLILFTNQNGKPTMIPMEFIKLPLAYKENNGKEIDEILMKRIF